ncbi:hypothetical protein N8087_00330 [Porticoccaceae bacterium]|nr:hypothetical protein [Porticoccaceae bacterium]
MDKSLAKGLTRRIFREHAERTHEKIMSCLSQSVWKKINKLLLSPSNDYTLSACAFGSKNKPLIGFSLLQPYSYNPKGWEENLFGVESCVISRNDSDLFSDGQVSWTISHHSIQRFLERTNLIDPGSFENAQKILFSELKYASLWCYVLDTIFGVALLKDEKLGPYIDTFSLIIPSPHGAFFARKTKFSRNDTDKSKYFLSVRTFLPLKELNDKQLRLRELMIKLGEHLYKGPMELILRNYQAILPYQRTIPESWQLVFFEFNSYLDSENFFKEYLNLAVSEKLDRSITEKIMLHNIFKSEYSIPVDARKEIFMKEGGPEFMAKIFSKTL